MQKVLVVSVHPDDETLGCGGTILKHKESGDQVYCLFVTNGNEHQAKLVQPISDMFGFDEIFQLNLPEIILDDLSLSELIPKFSRVFNQVRPEIVYLPNRSDPHSDHRKTFEAVQACIKSFRYPFIRKVMMCEVLSETDFAPMLPENMFVPHVFVDITAHMDKKMEVMKLFESELLEAPFTRSLDTIRAYHRYRGSQANAMYAEVFMLIKEIVA